jgi:regulator of RNase E activity RraB
VDERHWSIEAWCSKLKWLEKRTDCYDGWGTLLSRENREESPNVKQVDYERYKDVPIESRQKGSIVRVLLAAKYC